MITDYSRRCSSYTHNLLRRTTSDSRYRIYFWYRACYASSKLYSWELGSSSRSFKRFCIFISLYKPVCRVDKRQLDIVCALYSVLSVFWSEQTLQCLGSQPYKWIHRGCLHESVMTNGNHAVCDCVSTYPRDHLILVLLHGVAWKYRGVVEYN